MESANIGIPEALLKQVFPTINQPDGEKVLFSSKAKKYNRYGISQERIVLLSTFAVYLFSAKKVHTKVPIRELKYVIKSMHSKEFLLQFTEGIDLRIGGVEDREQLLDLIKERFRVENPN